MKIFNILNRWNGEEPNVSRETSPPKSSLVSELDAILKQLEK